MWKDECPILLISTHTNPIGFPCVPRRNGPVREKIPTSPVLLEYTIFIRGVDVADQLQASYSSLSRSHKWWHQVFLSLLDITEVNMYIMYLDRYKQGPNPVTHPLTHLQFKTKLCEVLLHGWKGRNEVYNEALTHRPSIHMPSHSTTKRLCVVCKRHTPHIYCYQCGFKFMCWKERCFQEHHEALARQQYNIHVLCLALKFASYSYIFSIIFFLIPFSSTCMHLIPCKKFKKLAKSSAETLDCDGLASKR
jgi:hypothetical protein